MEEKIMKATGKISTYIVGRWKVHLDLTRKTSKCKLKNVKDR